MSILSQIFTTFIQFIKKQFEVMDRPSEMDGVSGIYWNQARELLEQ
jgi:hypothetical protein